MKSQSDLPSSNMCFRADPATSSQESPASSSSSFDGFTTRLHYDSEPTYG